MELSVNTTDLHELIEPPLELQSKEAPVTSEALVHSCDPPKSKSTQSLEESFRTGASLSYEIMKANSMYETPGGDAMKDFRDDDNFEQIGSGSFGFVKIAPFRSDGYNPVVYKTIINLSLNDTFREVIFSLRMDNPNVVRMYGYVTNVNATYLFMERMNISMDKIVSLAESRKEEVVSEVAKSMGSALNYIFYDCYLVHSDVKPNNILVDNSGTLKICDFGCSFDHRTETTGASYTALYSPPERNQGKDVYDQQMVPSKYDVWSLGVVLVEMLIGSHPFKDEFDIFADGPLCKLPGNCSSEMRSFLTKCLAFEVEKRGDISSLVDYQFVTTSSSGKELIVRILKKMRCTVDDSNVLKKTAAVL